MHGFIYCRTNALNGKVYIGQCTRIGEEDFRWKECVAEAKKQKGSHLGAAIRKWSQESFNKEIIYQANTQFELDKMETFL